MIDLISGKAGDQAAERIRNELRTMYRARPFTKAVPFNQVLGTDPVELWTPKNSYFEVGKVVVRCDTANLDVALCDTTTAQPFLFIMAPTTIYQEIDLDPGYRSLLYSNARVLAFDPTGSGAILKGIIYGWEVNPDGFYR